MEMTKGQKTGLILLLGAVAAIGPFTIDMYLPGFPNIAKDLGSDEKSISYTLTSYFIGISIGQLFYGPILDKFGRKNPLIIGLIIYVLASLLCAFAPNLTVLVGARFLQALGASVGIVASSAIIRDLFDATEVARMLSSILLVMGVAPIIAPTLGSFFIHHYSWRSIFIFLFAISALVVLLIWFFLKETQGYNPNFSIKPKAIIQNYISTLSNSEFAKYSLAGSIAMSIMFAYIAAIPFILMSLYKVSESTFGWIFGMNAAGFILGSQLNRFLLKKFDLFKITHNMSWLQCLVSVVFLISAYLFPLPLWLFCALLFTILFLLGFINPNSTALSLAKFESNLGIASALNGSFRMGMGALVSFLMGIFYNGTVFPLLWFILFLSSAATLLFFLAERKNKSLSYKSA